MRGWEDFVKGIMEGNFVIEGIISDKEVKIELPPEFEAGFRENSGWEFTCDNCKKLFKRGWNLKGHVIVGHKRVVLVPRSELLKCWTSGKCWNWWTSFWKVTPSV